MMRNISSLFHLKSGWQSKQTLFLLLMETSVIVFFPILIRSVPRHKKTNNNKPRWTKCWGPPLCVGSLINTKIFHDAIFKRTIGYYRSIIMSRAGDYAGGNVFNIGFFFVSIIAKTYYFNTISNFHHLFKPYLKPNLIAWKKTKKKTVRIILERWIEFTTFITIRSV